MKIFKPLLILLVAALIFFSGFMLFHTFYVIDDVNIFDADVYVSDGKVGINTDTDALHFGIVPKGASSGLRFMDINNTREYPVKVTFLAQGELKGWFVSQIKYDNGTIKVGPTFLLEPGATERVSLLVMPGPESVPGGKYYGKIKVLVQKAK